jgi:hypothetical protein
MLVTFDKALASKVNGAVLLSQGLHQQEPADKRH